MRIFRKDCPVTHAIVALNVLVFLIMGAVNGLSTFINPSVTTLLEWGGNFAPLTLNGEPWRLVTCAFLHGGILHLVVNMYALYAVGPDLEVFLGKSKFALIYLFGAIASSIVSMAFSWELVSVGASGAICAIFGTCITYVPPGMEAIAKETFKRRATFLLTFLIVNYSITFVIPNIDNAAHMGGTIAGLLAGYVLSKTMRRSRGLPTYAAIASLFLLCLSVYLLDAAYMSNDPRLVGHKEFMKAVALVQNKKYEQSLPYFDKAAVKLPDKEEVLLMRARAYMELKKSEQALADVLKAEKLIEKKKGKDNSTLTTMKAMVLHNLGRFEEAAAQYERAIGKTPNEAILYNNRAWSLLAAGKVDDALKSVNVCLEKDPNQYPALDTRGVALMMNKQFPAAEEDFAKAIDLKKDDGAAYYHRAVTYQKEHKYDLAEKDFATAKKLGYELEDWEKAAYADPAKVESDGERKKLRNAVDDKSLERKPNGSH